MGFDFGGHDESEHSTDGMGDVPNTNQMFSNGQITFKHGITNKIGETEYKYFQDQSGHDLIQVTGRLSVYKKKILQKATHKENMYTLDP